MLNFIGEYRPQLLVMFGTLPSGVPAVRKLIDYLREVNSCPEMQVMCCGGIYKRAEGLSEEIGADLYAPDGGTCGGGRQRESLSPGDGGSADGRADAADPESCGAQGGERESAFGQIARWRGE